MSNVSSSTDSLVLPKNKPIPITNQDTDDDAENFEDVAKITRGKSKVYTPFISFRNKETAEIYLQDEVCGTKFCRKTLVNGDKIYYKCSKDCLKLLYMLMHDNHDGVSIYISEDEHVHKANNYRLPEKTMVKVRKLIDNNRW